MSRTNRSKKDTEVHFEAELWCVLFHEYEYECIEHESSTSKEYGQNVLEYCWSEAQRLSLGVYSRHISRWVGSINIFIKLKLSQTEFTLGPIYCIILLHQETTPVPPKWILDPRIEEGMCPFERHHGSATAKSCLVNTFTFIRLSINARPVEGAL